MELSTQQRHYQFDSSDSVTLTRPELIGYYSLDSDREYHDDYSQLKYINMKLISPQRVNMDLNHNINSRKKRLMKAEGLRGFLHFLKIHRDQLDVFCKKPTKMDDVPFVCCRGSLRAISKQPYENNEPTRFSVMLANGVIYMHILETPEMRKKEDMTERELSMAAWGYKFEQYMVSDDPCGNPDISSAVDENSEFNCIYKSMIGRHHLIYGAETDGFLVEKNTKQIDEDWQKNRTASRSHEDVVEYLSKHRQVELKTSRIMEEERHYFTFRRHKCLTWWLQSYFAGIDMVVCGYRNDDGIVNEISQYKTFDLPRQGQGWNANVCLNFCDAYLTFIKQALTAELKRQGHTVGKDANVRTYPPINVILHRKPRSPVTVDSPWPNEEVSVLDDWFLEMLPKP